MAKGIYTTWKPFDKGVIICILHDVINFGSLSLNWWRLGGCRLLDFYQKASKLDTSPLSLQFNIFNGQKILGKNIYNIYNIYN